MRWGVTLAAVAACLLGACGEEQSTDERQVRAALEEGLTTRGQSACTRLYTQRFTEQIEARRGAAAVRSCREGFEPAAARVAIGDVTVRGARAAADVEPTGGALTFKTVRIGLRRTGGRWKLDRLKDGTLDRPAFFAYIRKAITSPSENYPKSVADCVTNAIDKSSDETIVRGYVEPDARVLLLPSVICGARSAFAGEGGSDLATCVERRLRRDLTTGAVGRRIARDPGDLTFLLDTPLLGRVARRATLSCR